MTDYEYDHLHRRTAEIWLDEQTVVNTYAFEYDAAGQLLSAGDENAMLDYRYDFLGRVTQIEHDIDGLTPIVTLDQSFDANGNRTQLSASIDSTDDFLNVYFYDKLNRLTKLTQAGEIGGNTVADKRVDFDFDRASRYESLARYASLDASEHVATTEYEFDYSGRLTVLNHMQGITVLAGYTWQYDRANRLTQHSSVADGATDYNYDDRGQLVGADHSSQSDESYTYDDNGNRTNAGYETGAYNLLEADGAYVYEYDAEGNLIRKTEIANTDNIIEYHWDHRNRLMRVDFIDDSGASPVVTKSSLYYYDHQNRWIKQSIDNDGDGQAIETYFIQDGNQIVLELDSTGNVIQRYFWTPGADQLSRKRTPRTKVDWALTDHLGNPLSNRATIVYESHHLGTGRTLPLEMERKFTSM